ncbi:MAG: hypothetical protein ACOH1I_07470 [Gallionellaceae bacterium]
MLINILIIEACITIANLVGYSDWRLNLYASLLVQLWLFATCVIAFIRNKRTFLSPSFLFLILALSFTIFGEIIFLIRNLYGVGLGGAPIDAINYFRRFCFIAYTLFLFDLKNYNIKNYRINFDEILVNYKVKLFTILIFVYVGIYITTDGFQQISILSDHPDLVRYESRKIDNVSIGSILILFGIHAFVILFLLFENKKISHSSFLTLFLLFYIPFILGSSRLLMLLPFISIGILKIDYLSRITKKTYAWLLFYSIVILVSAFIFGAYRSQGSLGGAGSIIGFLTYDLFPEFSGAVYTQSLTKSRTFAEPFTTVLSGVFPHNFLSIFGINKKYYFQILGGIVGDLWNSNYSIRLSLMGELLYSSYNQMLLFLSSLVLFIIFISKRICRGSPRYRYIYVITGLLVALSVPYGSQFLVITIQFLIFSLVFFRFIK